MNHLGVGLHSYGFTTGVAQILVLYAALETGILMLAGGWWVFDRAVQRARTQAATDLKAEPA